MVEGLRCACDCGNAAELEEDGAARAAEDPASLDGVSDVDGHALGRGTPPGPGTRPGPPRAAWVAPSCAIRASVRSRSSSRATSSARSSSASPEGGSSAGDAAQEEPRPRICGATRSGRSQITPPPSQSAGPHDPAPAPRTIARPRGPRARRRSGRRPDRHGSSRPRSWQSWQRGLTGSVAVLVAVGAN